MKMEQIQEKKKHTRRKNLMLIICIFLLIVLFFTDILAGSVFIPIKDVFHALTGNAVSPEHKTIILSFRLPKALTAVLTGAALSISGLQMQTIFRNPLAGPYVLGISSGASLGVAVLILGYSSVFSISLISGLGNWSVVAAAWIGAGLILFLVLIVSVRIKNVITILILGIMFGAAVSSIVNILQYFSDESLLKSFVVWTMGSLGNISASQVKILAATIIIGIFIAFFSSGILNALLLGETQAKSIGVNIRVARVLVFLSTSILAGSVTAFCGPIGFIGIAVPHITRMLFQTANHYRLIPGCLLTGAIIMLISDIIAQMPGYQTVLPINSVTAIIGVPVVIWIILRNYRITRE